MPILELARPAFEVPADRIDEFKVPREGVRWLSLPSRRFVVIDGAGSVGEASFAERMPGLYAAAYTVHFALKKRGLEERVWPLELLMWLPSGARFDAPTGQDYGDWRWRLMIALPAPTTDDELATAISAGKAKLPVALAAELRWLEFVEGDAAQVMHFGPYSAERPTIERLHVAIDAAGLSLRGAHHEIYLGDPRRSAPEKLRTIIRQPVMRRE